MKTKSALSYFGSDSEVASQLAGLLSHCKHVTIPFVGGGSIIPHLTARAIVANDRHCDVITFYRVVSGCYGEQMKCRLIERCKHTLSHPDELEIARETIGGAGASLVDRAWAYWAMCWIGRKGKGGTRYLGGMPSVRRTASGGTNASRIRAAAEDLDAWSRHFERCEFESMDFADLLGKVADRHDAGVYCDPPWIGAGRDYLHPFSDEDHVLLAGLLSRFERTTVVVRYGDNDWIRNLYSDSRWRILDRSSRDQCNTVKGEIWITNVVRHDE